MSRQSSTGTSDWLLGAVKQNPEGLLLLAAGACLLLRKTGGKALFAGQLLAQPVLFRWFGRSQFGLATVRTKRTQRLFPGCVGRAGICERHRRPNHGCGRVGRVDGFGLC